MRKMISSICWLSIVFVTQIDATFNFKEFGDIAEGLGDLFGGSNNCLFQCPNGGAYKPNLDHKPSADGCGSYGFTLDVSSMPGMTECCNAHDYCYDHCGITKAKCDSELHNCLKNVCGRPKRGQKASSKQAECHSLSQMIYGGASALGCEAYLDAQKAACTCPAEPQRKRNGYHSGYRRQQRRFDDIF